MNMKHIVALSFGVLLLHKNSLAMDNDNDDMDSVWQPILSQLSPNMGDGCPNVDNDDDAPIIFEDGTLTTFWGSSTPVPYQTQQEQVPHHNNDDNNNNSNNDDYNDRPLTPRTALLWCYEKRETLYTTSSPTRTPSPSENSLDTESSDDDAQPAHNNLDLPKTISSKKHRPLFGRYNPQPTCTCIVCNQQLTCVYYLRGKHEQYCRARYPEAWRQADQEGRANQLTGPIARRNMH